MVTAGEFLSHQLSGDAGSLPSTPMLHKGDASPFGSLPQYGQHGTTAISCREGTASPSLYRLARKPGNGACPRILP